ncbi:MAG: lysylphosphatidylglycerol synthase transmembrane domain-containing protein [Myxococcaceae bacterium]
MKRTLKFILALTITVACFWWAFKDIRWADMWTSLLSANYLWLLPYVAILFAIHVCRTLRWGAYLSGMEKVRFRALNEAAGIGFMMLIVLPFRLGEFARPFLIAQRSSIRRSAAMTSVVLERIIDGIVIAVMLRVLLFFVPTETPEIRDVKVAANVMFLVFSGGLAFLLFATWNQTRAVKLVRKTVGVLSPGIADTVSEIVDKFVGATRMLPSRRQLLLFFFYTAVYWGLNGIGMTVLAKAFDCSMGGGACLPLSVTLFQGFVVLAVLVVGLMIPAAPGSAGTFQLAVITGLTLFFPQNLTGNQLGLLKSSAGAYANVLWLAQISQQVLYGLFLMRRSGRSFTDLAGRLNEEGKAAAAHEMMPPPPSTKVAAVRAP